MNKSNFTLAEFLVALFLSLFVAVVGAAATFSAVVTRVLVLFVVAFFVLYLWNYCVFGLIVGVNPIASYWHAFGLVIICNLLFKVRS